MPCFLGYFTILLKILCMKMMWSQVLVWSGNIYITLCFQIKKVRFQKFCRCGFLCPWNFFKNLRFYRWYGFWHLISFELNVPDAWFLPKLQYSIHILWKEPLSYVSDCNVVIIVAKNCLKILVHQIFWLFEATIMDFLK